MAAPPTSQYLIYVLSDPRTGEVRYVGQSSKGLQRPQQHWSGWYLKTEQHTHKTRWIKCLIDMGMLPDVEVVEEVEERAGLGEAERFWIAQFRGWGFDLTNATDGGDGRCGPCTEEHKRKVGDANRGRKRNALTRAKMSKMRLGRPSPNLGRNWSIDYRMKQAASHGSRIFVDEDGNSYSMLSQAAEKFNVRKSSISNVLHGRTKTAGGHKFRYVD